MHTLQAWLASMKLDGECCLAIPKPTACCVPTGLGTDGWGFLSVSAKGLGYEISMTWLEEVDLLANSGPCCSCLASGTRCALQYINFVYGFLLRWIHVQDPQNVYSLCMSLRPSLAYASTSRFLILDGITSSVNSSKSKISKSLCGFSGISTTTYDNTS